MKPENYRMPFRNGHLEICPPKNNRPSKRELKDLSKGTAGEFQQHNKKDSLFC